MLLRDEFDETGAVSTDLLRDVDSYEFSAARG
jgi:hypothetical protein